MAEEEALWPKTVGGGPTGKPRNYPIFTGQQLIVLKPERGIFGSLSGLY